MEKLQDKLALITVGRAGIGLASAKESIRKGARPAITGRSAERLEKAHQESSEIWCGRSAPSWSAVTFA